MVGRGLSFMVSSTWENGASGGGAASNPAGCPDNTDAGDGRVGTGKAGTGVIIGTGSGWVVSGGVGMLEHCFVCCERGWALASWTA